MLKCAGGLVAALALLVQPAAGQQMADPDFKPRVARPAYAAEGPVVVIDEAHGNFHTAEGRYKPFAELLRADGYRVRAGTAPFTAEALRGAQVLVIANAGHEHEEDARTSAFTAAEAAAVRDWVRGGGALFLIADHSPFGSAAKDLGAQFGVGMGEGWVFEPAATPQKMTTQLVFSRDNGRLGRHPILDGRDAAEAVRSVRAFTGQSLQPPAGAAVLLELSPEAQEAADGDALNAAAQRLAAGQPAGGEGVRPVGRRAQGLAMTFGKGRVVVLGEAAMLSAQVVRQPGQPDIRMGMNVPGYDNAQFALNAVRWLSGALD